MSTITVPPLLILAPIFLLGALSGFKRGWKDEAWTLGVLVLTIFIVARPDSLLLPVLERVIGAFVRAGQALLGRDTSGPAFRFEPALRPWATFLAFLVFVALAYAAGHLLGMGESGGGLWKLLGALLGALNLAIVVTWLIGRFAAVRGADGAVRLILPPFRGAAVVLGPPTTTSLLASWPGTIALLLVVIVFVALLTRASRAWHS